MQVTVTTIIFGLPTGQCTSHVSLSIPVSTLTVRELIAYKVRREVEEYLSNQRPGLTGEYLTPHELLQCAGPRARITPGAVSDEVRRAQQAFAAHAYMIVLDDRRIREPDKEITLRPGSRVEFIRILLQAGG